MARTKKGVNVRKGAALGTGTVMVGAGLGGKGVKSMRRRGGTKGVKAYEGSR